MNNKKILLSIIIPVIVASALLGTIALNALSNAGNNKAIAIGGNICPPTNLKEITLTSFPVKEPKSLPVGYSLQGIEDQQPVDVQLLYADHSLCTFPNGFDYDGHQLRIVVAKSGTLLNGTTYQQNWLKYAADPSNKIVAKVQPIEVNGHKGVGWDSYNTNSVVRMNGTIVQTEPFKGQAALFFFDDESQTTYSIFANDNQTLGQLEDVARSI